MVACPVFLAFTERKVTRGLSTLEATIHPKLCACKEGKRRRENTTILAASSNNLFPYVNSQCFGEYINICNYSKTSVTILKVKVKNMYVFEKR